MMCRKFNKMSP